MGQKSQRTNFRVEVTPRDPGDFGFARIGGQTRSEEESERLCESIASDIRRHVDDLQSFGNRGVSVRWDSEMVCEHCGSGWTETDRNYNGGCCKEDEDRHQEASEVAS